MPITIRYQEKLVYQKYHPGKFLVAWHPKSSTENERTTMVVKDDSGKEILEGGGG